MNPILATLSGRRRFSLRSVAAGPCLGAEEYTLPGGYPGMVPARFVASESRPRPASIGRSPSRESSRPAPQSALLSSGATAHPGSRTLPNPPRIRPSAKTRMSRRARPSRPDRGCRPIADAGHPDQPRASFRLFARRSPPRTREDQRPTASSSTGRPVPDPVRRLGRRCPATHRCPPPWRRPCGRTRWSRGRQRFSGHVTDGAIVRSARVVRQDRPAFG